MGERLISTILGNIDLCRGFGQMNAMLTAEQCRAARALLDWTQEELAEHAGVSRSTIRGFETHRHTLHNASDQVIRRALETAGVVLLDAEAGSGAGVRLKASTVEIPDDNAS
jgi:transcriptional regulator with XRE-family HTH domain